jgi:hypothetical protein
MERVNTSETSNKLHSAIFHKTAIFKLQKFTSLVQVYVLNINDNPQNASAKNISKWAPYTHMEEINQMWKYKFYLHFHGEMLPMST